MSPPPEPGLSSRVWLDAAMTQIGLAMARSIGDHAVKSIGVVAEPEVTTHTIEVQQEGVCHFGFGREWCRCHGWLCGRCCCTEDQCRDRGGHGVAPRLKCTNKLVGPQGCNLGRYLSWHIGRKFESIYTCLRHPCLQRSR